MSRKRGVPIGSVWSRSDGRGTVRTGESARAGVAAAGGAGRGRETRGGVVTRLEDGRGAVGGVTFHSGYLSFPHLTPAMPMVSRRFLAWLLPCISACVPLPFDKGLPCHSAFSMICLP